MKLKYLIFYLILIQVKYLKKWQCEMETMKYYGLMGIQRPIDYTSIYGNLYNDYCP